MNNQDMLEVIEFIVDNGGLDYYIDLLKNPRDINFDEESDDIKNLFKVWLEEFEWELNDINFMESFIANY